MKKCARCQLNFETWGTYNDHLVREGCKNTVAPVRTTDRTKEQIVDDAEKGWLGKHLVVGDFVPQPKAKAYAPAKPKAAPKANKMEDAYATMFKRIGQTLKGEAINDRGTDTAGRADGDVVQAGAWPDEAGVH